MSKLTVTIETNKDGFKITVPGIYIEQKCTLHASKEAKDKAVRMLYEAIKEIRGLKLK